MLLQQQQKSSVLRCRRRRQQKYSGLKQTQQQLCLEKRTAAAKGLFSSRWLKTKILLFTSTETARQGRHLQHSDVSIAREAVRRSTHTAAEEGVGSANIYRELSTLILFTAARQLLLEIVSL